MTQADLQAVLQQQRAFVAERRGVMHQVRAALVVQLESGARIHGMHQALIIQLQAEEPYLDTVTSILDDQSLNAEAKVRLLLQEADMQTQVPHEPGDMVTRYTQHVWNRTKALASSL